MKKAPKGAFFLGKSPHLAVRFRHFRSVLKPAFRKLPEDAMADRNPAHKRILLKLSGEALSGDADIGLDPKVLSRLALEIGQASPGLAAG